jgi:hypothetical protein
VGQALLIGYCLFERREMEQQLARKPQRGNTDDRLNAG